MEVERAALQVLQRGYTELQGRLLHQGPGPRREQLMEQLKQVGGEVHTAGVKRRSCSSASCLALGACPYMGCTF